MKKYLPDVMKELKRHLKIGPVCGAIIGCILSFIEGISIILSPNWGGFKLEARVAPFDFTVFFYSAIIYGLIGLLVGVILSLIIGLSLSTFPKLRMRFDPELVKLYALATISFLPAIWATYSIHELLSPRITMSYALTSLTIISIIGCYAGTFVLLHLLFKCTFAQGALDFVLAKFANLKAVGIFILLIVIISFVPSFFLYNNSVHSDADKTDRADHVIKRENRPNVILVCIDTLRADHLSCYGYTGSTSPNLDKLAEDGVLYANTYTQSSWTRPSVATIITSLYPSSHGIVQLNGDFSHNYILPGEALTLAEVLKSEGYHTGGFVTNPHVTKEFGFAQGFDEYHYLYPKSIYGMSVFKIINKVFKRSPIRLFYHEAEGLTDRALPWLKTHGSGPFFLYVHYTDPHMPYFRHPGFWGLARSHFHGEWTKQALMDLYDREISYVDHHVGRMIDFLRDEGLYNNTMVVITSDHGEEFFEHNGWDHGITLYEEQLRVPLIIKYSEPSKGGRIVHDITLSLDIAPSILNSANIKAPGVMQGAALRVDDDNNDGGRFVFSELGEEDKGMRSVRIKEWKLIAVRNFPRDHFNRTYPAFQLFNIISDPHEKNNLASIEEDYANHLNNRMSDIINDIKVHSLTAPQTPIDGQLQERLRSLGYIK